MKDASLNGRGDYACTKIGGGPITKKKRPKSKNKVSQDEAGCWLRENGKYTWVKLGLWGDPDVQAKYLKVCQRFYIEQAAKPAIPENVHTLAGLFTSYPETRRPHISNADWETCRTIASLTVDLLGESPVKSFDSLAYRKVQIRVAKRGEEVSWEEYTTRTGKTAKRRKEVWSFWYANRLMKRLKQMLRWGVSYKLFPAENLLEIQAVPPIGRGDEFFDLEVCEKRDAVPDEVVRKTLPFL